MSHVRHSIHIDAPPDVVWNVGRDPERMPEWNTTTIAVKDVKGPLDQAGAKFTVQSKIAGRPIDITWTIEQVEAPRYFVATASTPMGGGATQRVDYEPDGGGTRVTIDMDYEIAPGILGQVMNKLFAERALERDVHHSADNLKAVIEQEAKTPAGAR